MNGARGPKVVEHLVVHRIYSVQWKRPEINLMELAKLRWKERWSVSRLGIHFDRSPETIQMHICKLRAGGLEKLEFELGTYRELKNAMRQVFRGV